MAKSDYLENELIKHVFRTGTFTKPTNLYIALFTSAPSDAGGGTELSGNNYARVAHGPADGDWDATSGTNGNTKNTSAINFPTPSGNWGLITHFAIFDTISGGNMMYHGALTQAKTVNNGDPAPSFPVGALSVTES